MTRTNKCNNKYLTKMVWSVLNHRDVPVANIICGRTIMRRMEPMVERSIAPQDQNMIR